MKFGGTSVGTPEAMQRVVTIVQQARAEWPQVVVVTSALSGVTDRLLDTARQAVAGDREVILPAAEELRQRHRTISRALIPDPERRRAVEAEVETLIETFVHLCQAVHVLGEATPRALDTIAALGERMSVRLLAAALESAGILAQAVEATQLIVTDDRFRDAHPDLEATRPRVQATLQPLLDAGLVPVVTGFIAATPDGVTTTLGRGGSDYSAALLGAALPAAEVWIWTDVDGVMTADPRLVPDAHTIPTLSYREVAELAYFGAKVLHPKTIRPVVERGIPLRVRNTFNAAHSGTLIVGNDQADASGRIKAVTAIPRQHLVTIEGRGMLGVPGVAARAFGAVAATDTSVLLISQSSSEQSICFVVPAESSQRVLDALHEEFAQELVRRDIDRIWRTDEVVVLTVVGAGMQHTPGVAGQVFGRLGEQQVNVIAIAQGSSEASISMVVDARQATLGLRTLHTLIQSKEGVA